MDERRERERGIMAGGSNVSCDVTPVRASVGRVYELTEGRTDEAEDGRGGGKEKKREEKKGRKKEKTKGKKRRRAAQGWRGKKREGETLSSHAAWDGPRNSADKIGASTRAGRCIHNGRPPLPLPLSFSRLYFDLIRAFRLVLDNDISKLRGLVSERRR